jgi:putative hydrolase of the HAD superfamily
MVPRAFDVIAFDGDDTLWHNERSYRAGRERFRRMLIEAGVSLGVDVIERHITRTEVANIRYYGYGVSSFVLSLLETSIKLTAGRISGRELAVLIELAQQMMTEQVEVFDGTREVLADLAATYPLMLVTKGDLLHQRSKLERSGLVRYFRYVEIVSHKTPGVYQTILERHQVVPDRFLMVGNSLRSDVLPVVAAGGWAVHVPAPLTWSHEHARPTARDRRRYVELPGLPALVDLVRSFERRAARGARQDERAGEGTDRRPRPSSRRPSGGRAAARRGGRRGRT